MNARVRLINAVILTLFIILLAGLVKKYSTWENRLYVPTMIQKVNDDYFIVDCWNHRILYNDSLDKDLSSWSVLTDENYRGGHTVASDGRLLVCDNTDRSEILVYQKSEEGYSQTQVIEGALGRPHYVLYDEEHNCFYAIASTLGKLYEFKDIDGILKWTNTYELSEIVGSYVRSISIIDGQLYTVSGPGKIYKYSIDDDFSLLGEYDVPDDLYGMNNLKKIGSYYYITVNSDINGNLDVAKIIRATNLKDLSSGNYEILNTPLKIEGQPYYITEFDNSYFLTEISENGINGIIRFNIDNDIISSVEKIWRYKAYPISKTRYASKYAEEKSVVDLIIFAGQSNMSGKGDAKAAPIVEHGYEYRAITDPDNISPISEPFGLNENKEGGINDTWENMTVLRKSGGLVSSFANSYYETTGVPIVGVSCSEGATVIEQWEPDTYRYKDLVERCNRAKSFLENNNYDIRNVYMVWCQGESDGDNGISTEEYYNKLQKLVDSVVDNGIVDKVMVIRIGNYGSDAELYDNVIRAQTNLCEDNRHCVLISTRFAEMANTGMMQDDYHYTQEGYNLTGDEAGRNAGYYANTGMEPKLYDYEYNQEYLGDIRQ